MVLKHAMDHKLYALQFIELTMYSSPYPKYSLTKVSNTKLVTQKVPMKPYMSDIMN